MNCSRSLAKPQRPEPLESPLCSGMFAGSGRSEPLRARLCLSQPAALISAERYYARQLETLPSSGDQKGQDRTLIFDTVLHKDKGTPGNRMD